MHCLSDSVVAIHSLVYSVKTSFLSLAPLLLSQILFFFNSKNFQSFSSFSVSPAPCLFSLSLSKVPFYFPPFPFFFLSHSVWWKVLQCGARVPVVSMPTGCQAAARARSQGWETERQNERERERGFHRLHRTAFVPKSTTTIPRTPAKRDGPEQEHEPAEYQAAATLRQHTYGLIYNVFELIYKNI